MLEFIKEIDKTGSSGKKMGLYQCHCGNFCEKKINSVNTGRTKSCGCLLKKPNKYSFRHGLINTPEYTAWVNMKDRCYNKKSKHYKDYGGRGIMVCERWTNKENGFINFYQDLGSKSDTKLTLERIDNSGNYYPENCKWGTNKEQQNNKRNNRLIYFNGKTQTVAQLAEEYNLDYNFLLQRIKNNNWDIEEIIKRPSKCQK